MRYAPASGVILAGGESKRLGGLYKPLLEVGGRPMIQYSLEALRPVSEEILIVVRERNVAEKIEEIAGPDVRIVEEPRSAPRAPLIGLMEGARSANMPVIMAAPADTPFISPRVYEILSRELAGDRADAAVPSWPNGYIEPLIAAYRREEFLRAASEAASIGDLGISSALSRLKVRFVPVERLSSDPERTFFNVNTAEDLRLAREMVAYLEEGLGGP